MATALVRTPSSTAPRTRRRTPVPYLLVLPAVAALLLGLGYPVYWQRSEERRVG